MGMTDAQCKGMLRDSRLQWKEVLRLEEDAGNEKIIQKVQEQIELIDAKLKD